MLRDAVESIRQQTCSEWRCNLVVDGAADEATRRIAEAAHGGRIRTICLRQNQGPYGAMNVAIRECETEYFFFLGGDDVLPPNAIGVANKVYGKGNADYLCGAVRLITPVGESSVIPPSLPDADALVLRKRFPGVASFRKSVWEKLGGYPPELSRGRGDLDFIFGLIEGEFQGVVTNEIIYEYRQRSGSVSRSYAKTLAQKHEAIVRRHSGVFSDRRLMNVFLSEAYIVSAWACFEAKEYSDSALYARKYRKICGARGIWPLHRADQFPGPMVRVLVRLRRLTGRVKRVLWSGGTPVGEGATQSTASCAGRDG